MKRALAVVLFILMLIPAASADYAKRSASFFGTFDTLVTVMGYTQEEETFTAVVQEAERQFQRYHQVYDAYNAYEGVHNLYYLNQEAPKGPVTVEPELMDLLLYCRDMQPKTGGMMNIALGAVLDIWHDYRDAGLADPEQAELPPLELLQEASRHTDFEDILIDEEAGTVAFADPALRLDVGAVAKGYATEQVAQWMYTSDMPSFLISAGGNVRAGSPPEDGRARWGVSIQDPDGSVLSGANEDSLDVVFFSNASLVTSGDYQRYYVVDGRPYHHLISPDTLMPANYYRSVSVVCEDSGLADILSTACFLMPYEESRALADSLEGVEVFWMLNDGHSTIEMTDGMRAMVKSEGARSRD